MGGPGKYNATLDEHFSGGHNHHDNEPSHHYGYLYDFSGQPWKTQARVRQIAHDYYRNEPDGIAGNEDCGQMSAWYVFTAMGFYPLNPVSGDYLIGSPLFTRLTLQLPGGKRFVISAPDNSAAQPLHPVSQAQRPAARYSARHLPANHHRRAAGVRDGAGAFRMGRRLARYAARR